MTAGEPDILPARLESATMGQAFDVCIRGSGVVGRTLGLLLARERLKVAICGTEGLCPAGPGSEQRKRIEP